MRTLRIDLIAGILVLVVLILPSASGQETVELVHDKGVASSYRQLGGIYGFAVSFTPPNSNWSIHTVRIYGQRYGNQTEKMEFTLDIWGTNRSVLFSKTFPYTLFKIPYTWIDVDIAGPTVSENFYVVIWTGSSFQRGIRIGCDTSVANQRSEVAGGKQRFLADWSEVKFDPPLNKEQANWMIRVVGGGGAVGAATSQPFLGFLDMSRLQQIAGVTGTGGAAVFGWFLKTRKRRFVSGYLMKIDSTYNEYSMNREECKKRLAQMKTEAIQLLKKGKVDEPHFTLIENKLTQYLKDLS